jgi:hypothetical protein
VELPLILRILFIGTCWSGVGESILTPIELAEGGGDGEEEEEEDGADDRDDICAEAGGGSVMENNGVKLKVFQIRAKIKTANIELNLDNILVVGIYQPF